MGSYESVMSLYGYAYGQEASRTGYLNSSVLSGARVHRKIHKYLILLNILYLTAI